MSWFIPEVAQLLSGQLLGKKVRRSLSATLIARLVIMVAVAVLLFTAFTPTDRPVYQNVLIACAIAIATSHSVLVIPESYYRIRGCLLIIGIFAAGVASETDLCRLFFGRSSLFLALPAVIAPIVLAPWYAFVYWVLVQGASVYYALTLPHEFNVFSSAMLLVVCVVVWITTVRADRVIDTLEEEKALVEHDRDTYEAAVGVIITAEQTRISEYREWEPKLREMADRVQ